MSRTACPSPPQASTLSDRSVMMERVSDTRLQGLKDKAFSQEYVFQTHRLGLYPTLGSSAKLYLGT